MNEKKLIHELFIDKVASVIGYDKTLNLLNEATEDIKLLVKWQKVKEKNKAKLN